MTRPNFSARLTVVFLLLAAVLAGCRDQPAVAATVASTAAARSMATPTISTIVQSTSPTAPVLTTPAIPPTTTNVTTAPTPAPAARAYAAPPIQIPADYRTTFSHYATVDRTDEDGAVRMLYITPAAISAFQTTGVFPVGTMVIMEVYQLQLDATGTPAHDATGHLIPGSLHSVLVKLKTGTTATPSAPGTVANVTQRGWVYAAFDATSGRIDGFNQPLCQSCHLRAQASDDLFTRPELLAFAQNGTPQYLVCQLAGKQPCQVPDQ